VETGGVISAVTTNWPLFNLDCNRDIESILSSGFVPQAYPSLPEFPDVEIYIENLERRVKGRRLQALRLFNPFLLRTAVPPIDQANGKCVTGVSRLGKRIVFHLEGDLHLVLHLMIAGRLHWEGKKTRNTLAMFEFDSGNLSLTEAGTKRRASLHLVQGEAALRAMNPGGVEVFEVDLQTFSSQLRRENHTLKRALTDPRLFAGIGNAYSDEILHRAKLSPITLTDSLTDPQVQILYEAVRAVLREWTERLRSESFPEKVTAFREGMAVHGRYGKPCPVCGAPVQRIVYAENETNYCARCQTGGRILADRALSRLLKKSWPRSIDELP
jgi:formamidopyrimidine-DNA glycosylase